MPVPFPGIDPYAVLGVGKDSSPLEIKKAYKKLCLKYHPDKIQQTSSTEDRDFFPKVQFSYSVLGDPAKKLRYDRTQSLEFGYEDLDDDGDFDWKQFFDSMNEKITIEMIEQDKIKYQGSEEEKDDILLSFLHYDGDFIKLFEVIPHLEFDEAQEDRVFKMIENAISGKEFGVSLDASTVRSWEKYRKSRKTKVRQMLKRLAKEAKEAEDLERKIQQKGKKVPQNENDLKSLIQSKQANRLDDLINKLESKYVGKKGKKRSPHEISDDEFDKIQKKMGNNKNKRNRS